MTTTLLQTPSPSDVQSPRDEFLLAAYKHRAAILRIAGHEDQPASLREDAYWKAVSEIAESGIFPRKVKTYITIRLEWRIKDAIKRDARGKQIQGAIHPDRLVSLGDDGHLALASPWERFEYIDLARWLQRQDPTEAEAFLQRTVFDATYVSLGWMFGRDEFWAKRLCERLTKQLRAELGKVNVERLVKQAMRRNPTPPPVVPAKLARWEGRRIVGEGDWPKEKKKR